MVSKFPRQKIASASKTKQWYKDCTLNGVDAAFNEDNLIKPTQQEIVNNFKMYNGEKDPKELRKHFDSIGKLNFKYAPSFKNFSTIRDRIDELTGEYIEKGVEYVIAALDRDAINEKMEENKERLREALTQIYEDDELQDAQKIKDKLEDLVDFKFMSKAEVAANKILNYYKRLNNLIYAEIDGFKEALITATAIFKVDIRKNSLVAERCKPESIFPVRSGLSNDVRDSEIIAKVDYYPPSKIIDMYNETLTQGEVTRIIEGNLHETTAQNAAKKSLVFKNGEDLNRYTKNVFGIGGTMNTSDDSGNIRVVTLNWKGYRLIYKRKYYDDFGEVQHDYKHEKYKVNKARGEVLTKMWAPEEHQSTLIGGDIVTAHGVKAYQFNTVHEPGKNISGYVGGYFNVGSERAKSMIDNVANYLFLSDMVFARLEDLMAKNNGKAIELDLATMPKGWKVKDIMYYIKAHGLVLVDSMSEGNKGRVTGKMPGVYSKGTRTLDAELGISINYMLQFLALIDDRISRATGVTDQRLGAIHNRELVGNVERSRIQSSLITEVWFNRYEQIILDLYDTMLEMSKQVIGKDDKLQFVLDDMSFQIMAEDISKFANAKFGLFPVSSRKYAKLRSTLEGIAANAIANGNMDSSQLISLYDSGSMSEMIDKQYKIERERKRDAGRAAQQEAENTQKQIELSRQYDLENKQLDQSFLMEVEQLKADTKVKIESMKIQDNALSEHLGIIRDVDKNGIDDRLDAERVIHDIELKMKDLKLAKTELENKRKEISILTKNKQKSS